MISKGLLTAAYLLIINVFIYHFKWFQFRAFRPWITLLVFNLKFAVGILIWAVYTFYYTDVANNDVHKFYRDALTLHDIRAEAPSVFNRLMWGSEITGADKHKVSALNNWNRHFDEAPVNENRTIIRMNAWLMFLSFKTYFVHVLFMCLFSLLGLVLITNSVLRHSPPRTAVLALFVLLLPSLLFWTSGVMKEPLLLLGTGCFVYGISHLSFTSLQLNPILALLFGASIMFITKFFVLVCLLPATMAFLLFRNRETVVFIWMKYAIVHVVLLLMAFQVYRILPGFNLQQMLINKQAHSVKEAEYHRAGSRVEILHLKDDILSVVCASPSAVFNVIARPLVWESGNPMMLASAVENIFVILFLILCAVYTDWKSPQNLNLFLFLLFSSLAYFTLIGLATPVLGNLVRYKAPLLPFLLFAFMFRVKPDRVADNFRFALRKEN